MKKVPSSSNSAIIEFLRVKNKVAISVAFWPHCGMQAMMGRQGHSIVRKILKSMPIECLN